MLVGDESQAQVALSRGLDLHTDVLGQPNRYPVLNWVVQEIVQCAVAVMGPLIPTLVFCVQGTVELLKRIVREVGKLFHKSSSSENGEDEEDEGTDALYSAKGLLGTSRPKDFVLPQGTASPLVLAVLGSQDLFQTFLEKAGGAFCSAEQQQAALRLALLTERQDKARLIIAAGQPGIEANDEDGNTALQWLAKLLVEDEPDTWLCYHSAGAKAWIGLTSSTQHEQKACLIAACTVRCSLRWY